MISTLWSVGLSRLSLPISPIFRQTLSYTIVAANPQLDDESSYNETPLENPSQNPGERIAKLLSNITNLLQLRQIHAHIITTQFFESNFAPFHWNNIIRSYTRLNSPYQAFLVYLVMSRAGSRPDRYTLPITLKAVGQVYSLRTSVQLHGVAVRHGLEGNEFVESGLISMYAKAGEFGNAYKLFDESPERKLGSWNAIIAGLSQNGRALEAVDMFVRMRRSGVKLDGVTLVSVTSACGSLGNLKLALQLHKFVFQVKVREKKDILMLNSLIDIYGKCGRMDLAHGMFSEMDLKNVSSWTSLIVGYAMHGHAPEAMECFHAMIKANVMPNHVTFVGILSACVHGGMVDEGKKCFHMMKSFYGIEPQLQHYGCMADLLGRAGLLDEAKNMVERMPMKPNVVIWGCLLGASEWHNDVQMGEWVAKHFLELEPWNDGVYVVLSNIYASRYLWKDVERIREIMKQRRLAKLQGYSLATTIS